MHGEALRRVASRPLTRSLGAPHRGRRLFGGHALRRTTQRAQNLGSGQLHRAPDCYVSAQAQTDTDTDTGTDTGTGTDTETQNQRDR